MTFRLIQMKSRRGFTLIEIVAVVGVIGFLSTLAFLNYENMRKKTRDAQRTVDMQNIHFALESFYRANGRYPSVIEGNCTYETSFLSGGCMNALVTGGHIGSLPRGPSGSAYYYDGWCFRSKESSTGSSSNSQQFRMWTVGEMDHGATASGWAADNVIGETTCWDPQ